MNDRCEWRFGPSSRPQVFRAVMPAADAEFIAAFNPSAVLALLDRLEEAERTIRDVGFLWDYDINRGAQFVSEANVPNLRAILAGTPITDLPGFEWVAQARIDDQEASDDQ